MKIVQKDDLLKLLSNSALFLSIFFYPLGQLGRIRVGDSNIYFYIFEIFIFIFFILNLNVVLKHFISKSRLLMSGLFFIGSLGFSLFLSYFSYEINSSIVATLYFLRLSFYILLISTSSELISIYLRSKLLNLTIISGFIFIILTFIYQIIFLPKVGVLSYLGWDTHMYRVIGVFFEPPLAISFLAISVFILFSLKKINNFYKYFLVFLSFILSLFTYSRAGFLAYFSSLLYYSLKIGKLHLLIIFLFIMFSSISLITSTNLESINLFRTTSIQARITDSFAGISLWQEKPFFGIGYNQTRSEKEQFSQNADASKNDIVHGLSSFHSSFVTILVTGGVVGIIAMIIFLYNMSCKSLTHSLSIIFLSTISLFDNMLLHPLIMYLIFLIEFFRSSRTMFKNQDSL